MASSGENIDLGFRDLLFNSGVACMLLFIIFSIRTGKDIIDVEDVNQISNNNFRFRDQYSLVVDETVEKGNYKSVLVVAVEGVSPDQFKVAKRPGMVKWSDIDNKDQYISYNEQNQLLTFYMVVGELPGEVISLTIGENNIFKRSHSLTTKILDGKSAIETNISRGMYPRTFENVTLSGKEIIFRASQITAEDDSQFNLFDIK